MITTCTCTCTCSYVDISTCAVMHCLICDYIVNVIHTCTCTCILESISKMFKPHLIQVGEGL